MRSPTGVWLAFREVKQSRDYVWFGIISDVRLRKYIFDFDLHDRQIPADASAAFRSIMECYGDSLHNKAWYRPPEIAIANQHYVTEQSKHRIDPQPREPVPTETEIVNKIITVIDYPLNTTIPWAGTIRDFIGPEANFDESVRMLVGFDS